MIQSYLISLLYWIIGWNDSFVIFEKSLGWNLTNVFTCECPLNLLNWFLSENEMTLLCRTSLRIPFQSATQPGWMKLCEQKIFTLVLQLPSVTARECMILPTGQSDLHCWGISRASSRADDKFIWACLFFNWGSLYQDKFQRDVVSISELEIISNRSVCHN